MLASKCAVVSRKTGKISVLVSNIPPKELEDNEFPLTEQEYYLLSAVRGVDGNLLEVARETIDRVQEKYDEVKERLGK